MSKLPASDAIYDAIRHLRACVDLAFEEPGNANASLATLARDRFVHLVLHHDPDATAGLLATGSSALFHAVVQDANLIDFVLELPPAPEDIVRAWNALPRGDARRLFAGLFLVPPHELPELTHFIEEQRFDALLVRYIAWHPKCFGTDHERTVYFEYTVRLYNLIADLMERSGPGQIRPLLEHGVASLKSGAIYSCEGYLVPFAQAKSRLIRAYVRHKHGLDPVESGRPEPLPTDRPIRLGLLWNDIDPRTENFVGVASSRQLKAHGFHVVSVVHHNGYFGVPASDADTLLAPIQELSHEVVNLNGTPSLKDKLAAIRALDLDCLFFMNNITFGYNEYVALATLHLARWQAVNFCAVFTTGFPAVDLYVSGRISEGGANPQEGYTERLVRLPGSCLVFDRDAGTGASRQWLDVTGLRTPATTTLFASGANFYKIHPILSDTWARVLAATPNSRLVLYPFNPNWDSSYPIARFCRRFGEQLIAHGVDPARVTIAGPWKDAAVISTLLATVDIYLDSFPHSGGLSSLDALRLGIPVVTKRGLTQRDNQSADLLDLLGLGEHVTDTIEGYVATARRLSEDAAAWASYKIGITRGLHDAPFFDTELYAETFARELKAALTATPSGAA